MKKLLLILAIGAFVACNDNGSDEGATPDSTATVAPDTTIVVPDTTVKPVDTTAVKPDTTATK
jgi:hypothetical protein